MGKRPNKKTPSDVFILLKESILVWYDQLCSWVTLPRSQYMSLARGPPVLVRWHTMLRQDLLDNWYQQILDYLVSNPAWVVCVTIHASPSLSSSNSHLIDRKPTGFCPFCLGEEWWMDGYSWSSKSEPSVGDHFIKDTPTIPRAHV